MRRASLLTIALILFVDLVGFGILLPNQQLYGKTFGISNAFALVMIGPCYSLCQFLFARILGRWSDRIGRKPVLIYSQAGSVVGYLTLFASHFLANPNGGIGIVAIALLYLSRVIDGISGGNMSIALACVADVTTPENRARGMGIAMAGFGGGFVFGPMIGAGVSAWVGFSAVPLFAAGFSLAALILTIFFLAETRTKKEIAAGIPSEARRYSTAGILHTLKRPVIGELVLMNFCNGFAFAGMEQTFSLLIQLRAHLRENEASKQAGLLFGMIGIILVVIQGGMIRPLTKRFGEGLLIAISPLLIAAGLVIVGLGGEGLDVWSAFIGGGALLAIGSSLFQPSINSLVSRLATADEQGEVLGSNQGMSSLARGVGPMLAGVLYWKLSPSMPYFVSAGICVLVSLVAFGRMGRLRPAISTNPPP